MSGGSSLALAFPSNIGKIFMELDGFISVVN